MFLLSRPKGQLIDNWRCRPSIEISGIVQAIILSFKITLFVCHEATTSGYGPVLVGNIPFVATSIIILD